MEIMFFIKDPNLLEKIRENGVVANIHMDEWVSVKNPRDERTMIYEHLQTVKSFEFSMRIGARVEFPVCHFREGRGVGIENLHSGERRYFQYELMGVGYDKIGHMADEIGPFERTNVLAQKKHPFMEILFFERDPNLLQKIQEYDNVANIHMDE